MIKFFTFLALSKEPDLGFNTQIERVNHSDFELRFLIQEKHYLTSGVFYDVGANTMCGRGTWVSDAYPKDQANPHSVPCVTKDCWMGDCEGKEVERIIIENVRAAFREHFVDVCGYRQVKNEALYRFCNFLSDGGFDLQRNIHSLSSDIETNHSATYSPLG